MDIKERILKIVAENRTPDQDFCPDILIYWSGSNKDGVWGKTYNPRTGEIDNHLNNRSRNSRACSSYGYDGIYIKNHNGILELAKVRIENGRRAVEGERRTWEYVGDSRYYYGNHIFIDRETLAPYNTKGERIWESEDGKFYNKEVPKWFNSNNNEMYSSEAIDQFNEWTGNKLFHSRWQDVESLPRYLWNCGEVYKKLADRPVPKVNQYFLDIELPEKTYNKNVISFSIINEKYCVFRCYMCKREYDYNRRTYVNTGRSKENVRVYINDKGEPRVVQNISGKWTIVSVQFDNIYYDYSGAQAVSVGFDKLDDWKPISWVRGIIDANTPRNFLQKLIGVLRHPVIEKLTKSGYPHLAKLISGDTINASARDSFAMNKVNEKLNLYKMLGVNKHLLKICEEYETQGHNYSSSLSNIIYSMKDYFGSEDITSLSKETCQAYFEMFKNTNGYNWRYYFGLENYRWGYWRRNCEFTYRGLEDCSQKKIIERLSKLEMKDEGTVAAYRDARNIYDRLTIKPELTWDFRNREDIMQIHDNLQALYDQQQERYRLDREARARDEAEQYRKVFEKRQEDRIKKYEYENDKYQIVVPKDLVELTREGTELRHCVGGYLARHANGSTNIMFLRDKENPTVPFYTIEVLNNGYVEQIHGKCNQWLGNDPDAISFVWSWIKEKGFKCEKYKLLDTANGYCKSGKQVSESYLVA